MKRVIVFLVSAVAFLTPAMAGVLSCERIIRPARVSRGETNIKRLSLFDSAAWITHPDLKNETVPPALRVVRFRREFTVDKSNPTFEIDVSADERFYLMCDGVFMARGPHRGTPDNWMFQSYRLTLTPGRHVMEAVVWKHSSGCAPRAQLSLRLGFALAASGLYADKLTTGLADWDVGIVNGVTENGFGGGSWGCGVQNKAVGSGIYTLIPDEWKKSVAVRASVRRVPTRSGTRTRLWHAYPSQLKDQVSRRIPVGKCVNGDLTLPKVFKPDTVVTNIIDLGEYRAGYPELIVSGGRGASVEWKWAEALVDPKDNLKHNRGEWKGKVFDGFGDTFISDGRENAEFSSSWFRCGRWCSVIVKTRDEPLIIKGLSIIESRYPLECEGSFSAGGLDGISEIQDICVRSMQMCSHEMLFDCPFYEQQMYPGDTRTQLNVISAMTSDDALVRRAIEFYDLAKSSDGLVPFNFPSWGGQEGLSYTLCYLLMYSDYVMLHSDREWLKARLPGMRNTLSAVEYYTRDDGLLAEVPGWTFIDWPESEDWIFGTPPGGRDGRAIGPLNGYWLLALRGAVRVEEAMGNHAMASHWRSLAEKVADSCQREFWDEKRGLFADNSDRRHFSEHTQALMLLADAAKGEKALRCFENLISDKDLVRATVYFKYYLFETYFKFSRGDIFLKDLDLWRSYVALGATTCLECPETAAKSARSDCHAWGAHPVYFLRARIAGIMPLEPYFEKVRIAPQPSGLKSIKAEWPHPSGKMISVDLTFNGDVASGTILTPVPGVFEWKGRSIPLEIGKNHLSD